MKIKKRISRTPSSVAASGLALGANITGSVVSFRVWAPRCTSVKLKILRDGTANILEMEKDDTGYFFLRIPGVAAGIRYAYILDNGPERPDPVSRFLPDGLHGVTQVEDPGAFLWSDRSFKGIGLDSLIVYEVHIGTFTPEGTFEAAAAKIPYLKELGINCLEIMPVAQFPGERNWGYDGASLFAVQKSYGGPQGLKKLVNACHAHGISVCLDVVYNHFGPEGNYLRDFGPYFTSRYQVPWGEAVNFDGAGSGPVRDFFIENARYWIREFHMDALRLDAVHAIYDFSARHILQEISEAVEEEGGLSGRRTYVIAESDLNDARLIRPVAKGGYGLAGQWSDDFHHAVHALLTGERSGYYQDFGSLDDLAKALREGFVYDGRYSVHRQRCHGNAVRDLPPEKLVVSVQNHDQVGNRAMGERLGVLLPFEAQKLAAALLLLSPNTPMLFMGEEFAEKAPFQYFIDHEDAGLVRAVRDGRQKEFASFGWNDVPDPKSEETFNGSRLNWGCLQKPLHQDMLRLYRDLIALRKTWLSGKRRVVKATVVPGAGSQPGCLAVEYVSGRKERLGALFSFAGTDMTLKRPFGPGGFVPLLSTQMPVYGGAGSCPLNRSCREIRLPAWTAVFGRIRSRD